MILSFMGGLDYSGRVGMLGDDAWKVLERGFRWEYDVYVSIERMND